MYTGKHAHLRPLQPAFIMAGTGEAVTYAELEARSNRLAHLFRKLGLKRLDHYAIFMENNSRYLEACGAGERSGLYYTCVNSYLTPGELAYIVNNSESRVLITSAAKLDVAREALKECPRIELCVVADGGSESERIVGLREVTAGLPKTPISDESLGTAIHAAAPCPAMVKDDIIKWWGPIIHEYYGATEGLGFTACNSEEWLAHRGTVGKVLLGDLHILDENMKACPVGTPGTVWFKTATPFEYFNDPNETKEARSPDGSMSTVGDVGYVDSDGYLYLTDRATFMIISGGVNIYPQECENLLITHPKIADAAVFGVPNPDLGEEVKAVVQPMPGIAPGPELAEELISFCSQSLSRQKVPRSIDFEEQLPRLPTGKLYKRLLRDRYWGNKSSRIV